ncbi:MAG: FAD-dependent oxidoreductase, partial [Eggerthellaceae bacterium]|nr:FAD-dependent oxidoreductase [Eggerthellaceae bacterium]
MEKTFTKLLEPGTIGNCEMRNRMVVPAMGTNFSSADGFVTEQLINYIYRRAEGGVGLIITEITLPDPEGRVIPGELDMSKDIYIAGAAKLVNAAHAGGAKIFMQFAHGGCFAMKSVSGVAPATPSGIATFQTGYDECRIMTAEEIHELIDAYAQAALRAKKAGFDGIEIHCAHGYMPLQFLSPYTNRRTDEYGGSLENRARFSLEILRETRKLVGDRFPIMYRISAEEYTIPEGVTLDQACKFAKMLEDEGVDAIHVSAGTWDSRYQYYEGIKSGEFAPEDYDTSIGIGCQAWIPPYFTPRGIVMPLAAEVKKHVSVPIVTVNSVSPELGEAALAAGEADFVAFGRQTFADPDLPRKVIENRPEDIRRCLRCNECHSSLVAPFGVQCSINPCLGKEGERFSEIIPTENPRKVAVVGGGPAGVVAALVASQRGHEVTLYEKTNRIGGTLYLSALPSFKEDFMLYLKYLEHRLESSNVKVLMETEATAQTLVDDGFDAAIVGTGAVMSHLDFVEEGVLDPLKVLDGDVPEGDNIVVCGAGMVGCEVALELAEKGKSVSMIYRAEEAGRDCAEYVKYSLWARLIELHVKQYPQHHFVSVGADKVVCNHADEQVEITGDAVIGALGMKADRDLLEALRELNTMEVVPVGDANGPRKILEAVSEGFHAGRL